MKKARGGPGDSSFLLLLIILAAQIAIRLAIIWHTGPFTDQGLYGDDSYISLKLAANIAAGDGITQAGTPTNGFQPLFVFLLVPFYWFLDIYQVTVASALMNSLFSVGGSLLVFLILKDLLSVRAGLIGMALWALSEYLTRVCLSGLETSLANSMMLAVIYGHIRSVRTLIPMSRVRGAGLGVVMGLALLARFDLGLLLLPLGIDQLRVRTRRREWTALASLTAAAAVVVMPWFLWSHVVCGSLMPVSGQAGRTISQLYGSAAGPQQNPDYFPPGQVPLSFYGDNVSAAVQRIISDSPINIPVRALDANGSWVCGLWMAAWLLAGWMLSRKCTEGRTLVGDLRVLLGRLWFLWAFVPMLMSAYCFYFFAQWHFWRYMTPVVVALILPTAVCVDHVWAWAGGGALARWAVLAPVAFAFLIAGTLDHLRFFAPPDEGIAYRIYHDAVELRSFVTPGMRIGSFESGTLDYFLDVDVFNLDGKTNTTAYRELVAGRMDRLVETLHLDYVVSSPPLIRDLLIRRGRWSPGRLRLVDKLSHNVILKVDRDASKR